MSKADGTKKRTRRSAEDLRARIVAAAGEAFRTQGYDGATTAAIARAAEVTEAQLFRYFGSKAKLFRDAVFDPIDRHLLAFTDAGAEDPNAPETTAAYVAELRTFIEANAGALLSVLAAQRAGSDAAGPAESLQAYFDHGAALLGRNRGAEVTTETKLLVRAAFATVLGSVIFRDWLFPAGLAGRQEADDAINGFIAAAVDAAFLGGR